jgi:pseudouridine synthase
VGRLDLNSEGLLLLMDDGELAYRLMHPRYQIEKEYQVRVKGQPEESSLKRLREGIYLDGRRTTPARVVMLTAGAKKCLLNIGIHEGRKREIRRMIEAIGHTPIALKRIRFAGLTLGGLKPGQWRHLTSDEVIQLKKQVNLD